MRKWSIQNAESLEVMTPIFFLLYVPPGYPFTSVPTTIATALKNAGVVPDGEKFDREGRDYLLENIPVFCFNAR